MGAGEEKRRDGEGYKGTRIKREVKKQKKEEWVSGLDWTNDRK